MDVEYDPRKNAANIAKHGISLDRVAEMDLLQATILRDDRDYGGEQRFLAYGRIGLRLYVLWFTWRGKTLRAIGLRKANPRERKRYDQPNA